MLKPAENALDQNFSWLMCEISGLQFQLQFSAELQG